MAPHEFFFALELSSQGAPPALVEDLAASVFRHVGCAQQEVEGLSAAVEQAVEPGTAAGVRRCDVQFRARNGKLEVLVSSNGGRVWQKTILLS
jgi:hypothetical protein